ncbi:hypothetical protein EYF80_002157 [Liparis tanakae]|uniref:Uncharacterized protein n=1 Tax=Liparis tanakae TaxID=230148 RepID=A0A4Z2JBD6_9TELE|nr:hypothetical protein EYF80_002157 [Liparis tanakae]
MSDVVVEHTVFSFLQQSDKLRCEQMKALQLPLVFGVVVERGDVSVWTKWATFGIHSPKREEEIR